MNVTTSPDVGDWARKAIAFAWVTQEVEAKDWGDVNQWQITTVELLRIRFPDEETTEDEARVRSEGDVETLTRWFKVIALADSFTEVREAIGHAKSSSPPRGQGLKAPRQSRGGRRSAPPRSPGTLGPPEAIEPILETGTAP